MIACRGKSKIHRESGANQAAVTFGWRLFASRGHESFPWITPGWRTAFEQSRVKTQTERSERNYPMAKRGKGRKGKGRKHGRK